MDRLVTYRLLGEDRQATVKNAQSDQEAKASVIADISKSLHFIDISVVKEKKRRSLFSTYCDGFRNAFSFKEESTKDAEQYLDAMLEDAFPTKPATT